jgi:hypothetical protein
MEFVEHLSLLSIEERNLFFKDGGPRMHMLEKTHGIVDVLYIAFCFPGIIMIDLNAVTQAVFNLFLVKYVSTNEQLELYLDGGSLPQNTLILLSSRFVLQSASTYRIRHTIAIKGRQVIGLGMIVVVVSNTIQFRSSVVIEGVWWMRDRSVNNIALGIIVSRKTPVEDFSLSCYIKKCVIDGLAFGGMGVGTVELVDVHILGSSCGIKMQKVQNFLYRSTDLDLSNARSQICKSKTALNLNEVDNVFITRIVVEKCDEVMYITARNSCVIRDCLFNFCKPGGEGEIFMPRDREIKLHGCQVIDSIHHEH